MVCAPYTWFPHNRVQAIYCARRHIQRHSPIYFLIFFFARIGGSRATHTIDNDDAKKRARASHNRNGKTMLRNVLTADTMRCLLFYGAVAMK